jgi:hypothetical protein
MFNNHNDDNHVLGGSIWAMPHMGGLTFGTATPLITSMGENNYYPGWSPDGQFLVFNRVEKQAKDTDNDSFSNPKAKVWVLPTNNSNGPIECTRLNTADDVSNSWPRWSPFIQNYKGNRLLWVTFSSTRDYGVLVHNDPAKFVPCYPSDSFLNQTTTHHQVFAANCKQPQVWMAAINLSSAEFMTQDPSYPAFWLPFQSITTVVAGNYEPSHNHSAQWTTTVVTMPTPDGGACIGPGENCLSSPDNCCAGFCLSSGVCGVP